MKLRPVQQVPKEERWLFDPKNKEIVDELKKALKQKADRSIDFTSFYDYAKVFMLKRYFSKDKYETRFN